MKDSSSITQYFHTPTEEFLNSSLYITWAGHRDCHTSYSIGPRLLDSYTLVFVIRGQGYLRSAGQKLKTVKQGDAFLLSPKEKHAFYTLEENPWEIMWIAFNGQLAPTLLSEAGFSKENTIISNLVTHSVQRIIQTIINALGDTADTYRLYATGQLYVLFAYIKQIAKVNLQREESLKQSSCVWKAIRFIEQHYYLDIDVSTLCDHVNYSRSYLSRTFKTETGMSIPEYTNKVRIQNATNLLTTSQMPVREIAMAVGMKDSFYFSKLFKKITGETPREYRKNHM